MGIFDDEKVLHAETVTAKLFEDEPDPIKRATMTAILTNGDIRDFQHAAYLTSFALNTRRYYNYGKDKYTLGLPTGTIDFGNTIALDELKIIQDVIEKGEGVPVIVTFALSGIPIPYFFGYQKLRQDTVLGFDVPSQRTTIPYGFRNQLFQLNYIANKKNPLTNKISLVAFFTDITVKKGTLPFPSEILEYPLGPAAPTYGAYIQAAYHYAAESADDLRYFTYNTASNTYPELNFIEEEHDLGHFYPVVPLRVDNKFITEDRNPELYESSRLLLKKIHLKQTELIDALKGSPAEYDSDGNITKEDTRNEDLDKMDDCYFMFALDIYTKVEASIEYFYEFFGKIADQSPGQKAAFDQRIAELEDQMNDPDSGITAGDGSNWNDMYGHTKESTTGHYKQPNPKFLSRTPFGGSFTNSGFSVSEGNDYSMRLKYNYVHRERVIHGVLKNRFERIINVKADYTYTVDHGYNGNDDYMGSTTTSFNQSTITWRKRLTPTTYSEVVLHGPIHNSIVEKEGEKKAVERKLVREANIDGDRPEFGFYDDSEESAAKGDSGFYIPISPEGLKYIPDLIRRSIVQYDAAMLVIFAGQIEVIKWYQKGIFKILLMIVIFVISVALLMFGPQNMPLVAAMWATFTSMMIGFVLSIVIQLILKEIGGTLGFILAVVLTIIVAWQTGQFNFDAFNAANMLQNVWAISGHVSNIIGLYQQSQMYGLQEEYEAMLKDAEEQQEELDEAYDLLTNDNPVYDPLFIIHNTSMISRNETADEFLRRTLLTNPGRESLKVIEKFVEGALTLPTPDYMSQGSLPV